jgi:hypothetical protein
MHEEEGMNNLNSILIMRNLVRDPERLYFEVGILGPLHVLLALDVAGGLQGDQHRAEARALVLDDPLLHGQAQPGGSLREPGGESLRNSSSE